MKDPEKFIKLIENGCSDRQVLNGAVLSSGMSDSELRMAIESVKVFKNLSHSSKLLGITKRWIGGTS